MASRLLNNLPSSMVSTNVSIIEESSDIIETVTQNVQVTRHLFYYCNTPSECCPFLKTFSYICSFGGFCRLTLHIVKVFFASPFVKMWKFSYLKDSTEQHSLSYRYMWLGAFCIPISHIYPSVGYCVVYFR